MGRMLSNHPITVALVCALVTSGVAHATLIQYDDGSLENSGATHGEAVRFTMPSGSASGWLLNSVTIYVRDYPPTGNTTINPSVWEDNGGELAPAAVGNLLYETTGTVGALGWYTFDLSAHGLVIPSESNTFVGWVSDDWLIDYRDYTNPQRRSLGNPFGSGWDDPGDPFPSSDYNAPVRLDVQAAPVPEPASLVLLALAVGGTGAMVKKGRK